MELPDLARSHHDILPSSGGPTGVSPTLATPFGNVAAAKLAPFAVGALVAGIVLAYLLAFRMRGILLFSFHMGFLARGERPNLLAVVIENVLPALSLIGVFTLASAALLKTRSTLVTFAVLVPLIRLPLVVVGVVLGSLAAAGTPVERIFVVHRACQSLLFVVLLYLYYGAFMRAAGREKGIKIIFIVLLSLIVAWIVNGSLFSLARAALAARPAAVAAAPGSDDLPYRDGESIILSLTELDKTKPSDFRQQVFFERLDDGNARITRHLYENDAADTPLHMTATIFRSPALSSLKTMIRSRGLDRAGQMHQRTTSITWADGKATFETRTDDGEPRTEVVDAPPEASWHEDIYLLIAALPLRDGYQAALPVLRQRLSLLSAAPSVHTLALTCRLAPRPAWLPPGDDSSQQCFRVALNADPFSSPTYAYYDHQTRRFLGVDIVMEMAFARLAVVSAVASRPAGDFSLDWPADSR